jgi:hypothetical protein
MAFARLSDGLDAQNAQTVWPTPPLIEQLFGCGGMSQWGFAKARKVFFNQKFFTEGSEDSLSLNPKARVGCRRYLLRRVESCGRCRSSEPVRES